MSAFIVSRQHIDYLVAAATNERILTYYDRMTWEGGSIRLNEPSDETRSKLGTMLWEANRKSVQGRYPHIEAAELPGIEEGTPFTYEYTQNVIEVEPIQVLKALQCYDYQSCEADDWKQSEAYSFCETLRSFAICALVGYKECRWGIQ